MRQSRLMSLVEALANVVVGYVAGGGDADRGVPDPRASASLGQNLELARSSRWSRIARSYALRRMFEAIGVWAQMMAAPPPD